jgi:hypothetical protein
MNVEWEIEETVLEGENGHDLPSVQASVRDVSTKRIIRDWRTKYPALPRAHG